MPTADATPSPVRAPFHGMVTVFVVNGDDVAAGEVVAVLEAMKMEAPITAPRAGTVHEVMTAEPGTVVAGGELLLVIT